MSTITKEWLQQAIKDYESVRDELPFGLDDYQGNILAALRIAQASLEAEAVAEVCEGFTLRYIGHGPAPKSGVRIGDRLYTATPAPANAEPVAWLWSHRKHPSEVTLVRPEDDERAEGAHWSGWSCQALYAEPPTPVSVPAAMEMDDDFDSAFEHGKAVGWNAYRAAMLQGAAGNSPAIPDGWVLVPKEPTPAMLNAAWVSHGIYHASAYRTMLAAAPQQEVRP
jgi:hypothetical protein